MSLQPETTQTPEENAYHREKQAREAAEQARAQAEEALAARSRELDEARQALAAEQGRARRADADLKAAQERLGHPEELAAADQRAKGVADEISDPIAFIRSNLTTLNDHCIFFERLLGAYQALADAIRSGGSDQLPELIDSIDSLAQTCDPDQLVKDVAELVAESSSSARRVAEIVAKLG